MFWGVPFPFPFPSSRRAGGRASRYIVSSSCRVVLEDGGIQTFFFFFFWVRPRFRGRGKKKMPPPIHMQVEKGHNVMGRTRAVASRTPIISRAQETRRRGDEVVTLPLHKMRPVNAGFRGQGSLVACGLFLSLFRSPVFTCSYFFFVFGSDVGCLCPISPSLPQNTHKTYVHA